MARLPSDGFSRFGFFSERFSAQQFYLKFGKKITTSLLKPTHIDEMSKSFFFVKMKAVFCEVRANHLNTAIQNDRL